MVNNTTFPYIQARNFKIVMWTTLCGLDGTQGSIYVLLLDVNTPVILRGTSTVQGILPGSSRSAQNLEKASASNCNFLAEMDNE
ncbi:hypothetical protein Tco_1259879 [Tanacetum coccineum]